MHYIQNLTITMNIIGDGSLRLERMYFIVCQYGIYNKSMIVLQKIDDKSPAFPLAGLADVNVGQHSIEVKVDRDIALKCG